MSVLHLRFEVEGARAGELDALVGELLDQGVLQNALEDHDLADHPQPTVIESRHEVDPAEPLTAGEVRGGRQRALAEWASAAFGAEQAASLPQRALRLLEEAAEAYQAAGGSRASARFLVDYVFGRPAGELGQELGGVGVTLLALAEAAGLSADAEEAREVERVLALGPAHFAPRNREKCDAGLTEVGVAAPPARPTLRALSDAVKLHRIENRKAREAVFALLSAVDGVEYESSPCVLVTSGGSGA